MTRQIIENVQWRLEANLYCYKEVEGHDFQNLPNIKVFNLIATFLVTFQDKLVCEIRTSHNRLLFTLQYS